MFIEIEKNPNCPFADQHFFNEIEPSRKVRGIKIDVAGEEQECAVIGVDTDGKFVPAVASKITDSNEVFAFVIHGGAWGIRLRPKQHELEPWDLKNKHQWGESFKIYTERDILFEA